MQIEDMFWVRLNELHRNHADSNSYKDLFSQFDQKLICPDFDSMSSFEHNGILHFGAKKSAYGYNWIDACTDRNRWNTDLSKYSKWYFVISSNLVPSLDKKYLERFKVSQHLPNSASLSSEYKFLIPNSY